MRRAAPHSATQAVDRGRMRPPGMRAGARRAPRTCWGACRGGPRLRGRKGHLRAGVGIRLRRATAAGVGARKSDPSHLAAEGGAGRGRGRGASCKHLVRSSRGAARAALRCGRCACGMMRVWDDACAERPPGSCAERKPRGCREGPSCQRGGACARRPPYSSPAGARGVPTAHPGAAAQAGSSVARELADSSQSGC
jgi:hypothetical protein